MKRLTLIYMLFQVVLFPSFILSQINISSISFNIGSIRTLFKEYLHTEDYLFTIYPEIQVGGILFKKPFYWLTYWGYWDDNVNKPLPVMDMVTYSYQSHIVGSRGELKVTEFEKNKGPFDVALFLGLSRHFVRQEYVGGFGYGGNRGFDRTHTLDAVEMGLKLKLRLSGSLSLLTEIQHFRQLSKTNWRFQEDRNAYKTGLSFDF